MRCAALTAKGTECTLSALPGGRYCLRHSRGVADIVRIQIDLPRETADALARGLGFSGIFAMHREEVKAQILAWIAERSGVAQ